MTDYLYIGSSPANEECVSVEPGIAYHQAMRQECRLFIEAIRRKLGPEPVGCSLALKRESSHDAGEYFEVICKFDSECEAAVNYAFRAESDAPLTWAEVGMTVSHSCVDGTIVLTHTIEERAAQAA